MQGCESLTTSVTSAAIVASSTVTMMAMTVTTATIMDSTHDYRTV